ncbi:MAG: HIT domain-containing protein [archaeon]
MLPPEQITQIKKQIIQQIESTFPEDKKKSAIQQIESMNSEQLEEFLKQNKLMKQDESPETQQCIFCSIVSGQAQSYKIDENSDSIAILEINPISKAHVLIIPKEHISSSEKLPKSIFTLAKKIAKKIKTKFKPKDVLISSANLFGHEIANVLPVYTNETLESKRSQAKPEELEKLKKQLEKKTKPKVIKESKPEKIKEKLWLPKRIP